MKPPLPTQNREHARSLRGTSTDAENKLWQQLRGGRLSGFKFRRQHPIPPYIADFYCEALHLVVELDGSQHTQESDSVRTRFLESQGLMVLRFWDNAVLNEMESVLEAIHLLVDNRTLTPTPLPVGEGLSVSASAGCSAFPRRGKVPEGRLRVRSKRCK